MAPQKAKGSGDGASRLELLRKRNLEQLAAQREAERRVDAALKAYVKAEATVAGIEQERDEKIANLEQQIEKAHQSAAAKVDKVRAQQAVAVYELNNGGRTLEQIAELLDISLKEARRLLGVGREAAEEKSKGKAGKPKDSQPKPAEATEATAQAVPQAQPAEQAPAQPPQAATGSQESASEPAAAKAPEPA